MDNARKRTSSRLSNKSNTKDKDSLPSEPSPAKSLPKRKRVDDDEADLAADQNSSIASSGKLIVIYSIHSHLLT